MKREGIKSITFTDAKDGKKWKAQVDGRIVPVVGDGTEKAGPLVKDIRHIKDEQYEVLLAVQDQHGNNFSFAATVKDGEDVVEYF